jgi:hypothetical protein
VVTLRAPTIDTAGFVECVLSIPTPEPVRPPYTPTRLRKILALGVGGAIRLRGSHPRDLLAEHYRGERRFHVRSGPYADLWIVERVL